MCHSRAKTKYEMLKDGIELASKVESKGATRDKLVALMLVLSNKYVDETQIDCLWEEFKNMASLKVLDIAERKGREQGMVQGIVQGREQGMAQGREQGMVQGLEETAIRMIKDNVDMPFIAKMTNLPIERIIKLKNSIH
jgi:flagellar biosynthesis/type III secretory pathway protein FliH